MKAYLLLSLLAGLNVPGAELEPIYKLDKAELEARLQGDARAVQVQRQGLRTVISYVESRPDLFPAERPTEPPLLRREEKEAVWNTWQRFLDYLVALDPVGQYHAQFHRLKGAAKEDSFLIGYAARLAKYRAAMEFIDRTEHNPDLDKVLNDSVPELGLPSGTPEQQFDLVSFLDGEERQTKAVAASLAGFRESWKRPSGMC